MGEAGSDINALLSMAGVASWLYDPRKGIVSWQRLLPSKSGDSRSKITERLVDVVSRYQDQDRAALLRHYETALREGQDGPIRLNVSNKAGDSFPIESAAVRIPAADGQPLVRGVYRSCAAETGRAFSLPDALMLLGDLTEMWPSAILLLDETGMVRGVNPAFLGQFRVLDKKLLLDRPIRTLTNHLGKNFVSTITTLLDNGKDLLKAQQRFMLPDESHVTLNFRSQRFDVAGRKGVLFVGDPADADAIDMGLLFHRLPTPMMAIDLSNNTIVAANSMSHRTFGIRREHIGRQVLTQILMKSEDLQRICQDVDDNGMDAGYVCAVRGLMGGGRNYHIKATAFMEEGRKFLALEFHPVYIARGKNRKSDNNRKGLIMRVVDHLDF